MIDWVKRPSKKQEGPQLSAQALQKERCQAYQPDFIMADVRNTGYESAVKQGNVLILVWEYPVLLTLSFSNPWLCILGSQPSRDPL